MLDQPRVLMIQNDAAICDALRHLVEEQGAVAGFAFTLAEGVKLCKDWRPTVVLLDLTLPDGGGLEAFRQIRAINPRYPVVTVVAADYSGVALTTVQEGAFSWLVEPVALDSLRRVLQCALEAANQGLKALIASLQRVGENDLYVRAVQALEQVLLSEVLRQTHGNTKRASEILGIDRKTLRKKMSQFGLLAEPFGAGSVAATPGRVFPEASCVCLEACSPRRHNGISEEYR